MFTLIYILILHKILTKKKPKRYVGNNNKIQTIVFFSVDWITLKVTEAIQLPSRHAQQFVQSVRFP